MNAKSQEHEDEDECEQLYYLEHVAPRPPPQVKVHIPTLIGIVLLAVLVATALVLGFIDEVRFLFRLFR